jgi:hypothetical protein
MREHDCSEEQAIAVCRARVMEEMSAFNDMLQNLPGRGLSRDTVVYLEAVRWSYIGNLVWSIYCPRYHDDEVEA